MYYVDIKKEEKKSMKKIVFVNTPLLSKETVEARLHLQVCIEKISSRRYLLILVYYV